jgi:hypothetical protein
MITKKQVKDQIRGMNGDFTLGDVAHQLNLSRRTSILYIAKKELLSENVIIVIEESSGKKPTIYRVRAQEISEPTEAGSIEVVENPSFEDIITVRDGFFTKEAFGDAVFDKMLRLGLDISEKEKRIQEQKSQIMEHQEEIENVRANLLKLIDLPNEIDVVDTLVLVARVADILSQQRSLATQAEKYHIERKENVKLSKKITSLSNVNKHLEMQKEELTREVVDLRKEVGELTEKINRDKKGNLTFSNFKDLGKAFQGSNM